MKNIINKNIVNRFCLTCNKKFVVRLVEKVGKYCSRSCGRKVTPEKEIISLKKRYEQNVIRHGDNDCWSWNGWIQKKGYGGFSFRNKEIGAHRASYMIHIGPIPNSMHVLHSCDVAICSNPKHLWLGTNTDNINDMVIKGRNQRGEKCHKAKLNEQVVLQIKQLIREGMRHKDIGEKYGVVRATIGTISQGKAWKHVK